MRPGFIFDSSPAGRRRGVESSRARKLKSRRATLEGLESRTLLATVPEPFAATAANISDVTGQRRGDESSPSVAVDPTDASKMVSVWTNRVVNNDGSITIRVRGAYSTDGGGSWSALNGLQTLRDLSTLDGDAMTFDTADPFARVTDASVGFDRLGNVYVMTAQHNDANTSGALVLQKFDFSGGAPVSVPLGGGGDPLQQAYLSRGGADASTRIITSWQGGDHAAFNPSMVVDNVATSPNVGNVYVAWNTNDVAPTDPPSDFNPNTIKVVVSSDGGTAFSAHRLASDGSFTPYRGDERNTTPRMTIGPDGQLSFVWDDFGSSNDDDRIVSDRVRDGGAGGLFPFTGIRPIRDAGAPSNVNFDTANVALTGVGNAPVAIATGDFDQGNGPDLVAASGNRVAVLINDGNGNFPSATFFNAAAAGSSVTDVAVGDVDGVDGPDIIAAHTDGVSVLLNNGNGTFRQGPNLSAGQGPSAVAVGDVDGANRVDIVVANAVSNNVTVLLNSGTGTFLPAAGSPIALPAGSNPSAIALADFDGATGLDIVVANQGLDSISVLLNDGAAAFTPTAGSPIAVGTSPVALAVGNLDGATGIDIVVANNGSNDVSVLLNDGAAAFSAAMGSPINVGAPPTSVVLGDFDDNNNLDLAVSVDDPDPSNDAVDGVRAALGLGNGTFSPLMPFEVRSQAFINSMTAADPSDLVTADFDDDNNDDLAITDRNLNTVSVLRAAPQSVSGVTDIPINVTLPDNIGTLNDLDVSLSLTHPDMSELSVELVPPPGLGLPTVTLFGRGSLDGANMGVIDGAISILPTIFDSDAPRSVFDQAVGASYNGRFRPQGGLNGLSALINAMRNLTAANGSDAANGSWTLRIRDFVDNDPNRTPSPLFRATSLNFTADLTPENDLSFTTMSVQGNLDGTGQTASQATPLGIAPRPVIAVDNNPNSPFFGQYYLAYTDRFDDDDNPADNTEIYLRTSTDGVNWSGSVQVNDDDAQLDGFSEATLISGRPQFDPQVTVDQSTGAVVLSWYDARHDAARARVAQYVGVSIDGGQVFSQTFVNPSGRLTPGNPDNPAPVIDAITGEEVPQFPIPDNQSSGNPVRETTFGFGTKQGLVAAGGQIITTWSSNLNYAGNNNDGGPDNGRTFLLDIRAGRASYAVGPRIISSSMGPVTSNRRADGTPTVTSFDVIFDRPIDPTTVRAADARVFFRDTTQANVTGRELTVRSVQQLSTTRFRFTFDPLPPDVSPVGTYSYTVGPNITDLMGNVMDQDHDGTPGEVFNDVYRTPVLLDQTTLPLIVPGPYVLSSQVPGAGNLAQNRPVDALDVTFDRDMRVATFKPNDVLRIIGKEGLLDLSGVTVAPSFSSSGVATDIPDNGVGSAMLSLVVPDDGGLFRIADLNVRVDLTHPDVSELNIVLIAPDGTQVPLVNAGDVPSGRNLTGTTFDDQAPRVLSQAGEPFSGRFKPAGSLGALLGKPLADPTFGRTWKLMVTDTQGNTLPPGEVQRLLNWSMDVTPDSADPAIVARTFRISFPMQQLSGTYTITLGPEIRSADGPGDGHAMDQNQNAGVDLLRGFPAAGTATLVFPATGLPQPIPDDGSPLRSTITINENFVIQDVNLTLSIRHPNVPDLSARLIVNRPDGSSDTVTLFTNVGDTGTRANFTNTIFDDEGTTPIQNGTPPFFSGFNSAFNPETPLSVLDNQLAAGTYTLEILDEQGNNLPPSQVQELLSWSLTMVKALPASGLGEEVADRAAVDFRIFSMAPTNPLASSTWTPVGPASINNGSGSGRIGGIAVDPSDPSGNTVYAAGATGGVWKTDNFLTTSGQPTWVPLIDQVATRGVNIGGITVFPRDNDPNKSIVFVATGDGDGGAPGVGFLRSMDGGATWTLLDSTDNTLPFDQRDHALVNSRAFKVAVDPRLTPDGEVIVYAALTGTNGGVWRSVDSGDTWQLMRAGQATDLVLDLNSDTGTADGNLNILYAAFRGEGIFQSVNRGQVFNQLNGGLGVALIQDAEEDDPTPIPVNDPARDPNGPKGRIVLAKPALTGNELLDLQYQGWLYAVVAAPDSSLDGLYMTKDFGANWTYVRLPNQGGADDDLAVPSNDTRLSDVNVLGTQGNYDITLAVSATDPNVVYIGGQAAGGGISGPTGLIRVDVSNVHDARSLVPYEHDDPDGGTLALNSTGPVTLKRPTGDDNAPPSPFTNLLRNPFSPFLTDSTLSVINTAQFVNDGDGAIWQPMDLNTGVLQGSVDQHRIVAMKDPLTGRTRLIFGDDHGLFTGVDRGDGLLIGSVGSAQVPTGTRNGNLQITQLYYGATQPSDLAAQIAGALFYGQAQDDGFPRSSPFLLQNGAIDWGRGSARGDGSDVAVDQTGSGTAYVYNWPCCGGFGTNFFQLDRPDGTPSIFANIGRTFGLVRDLGGTPVPDPQWPNLGGFEFAVNPIRPAFDAQGNETGQIILGSGEGRLYSTERNGLFWSVIAEPSQLDGSLITAPAYGAPDPNGPAGVGNLNNFLYAGTQGGRVFVTETGGGSVGSNSWRDISAGLDGSTVQAIATNPQRGSHEAYAVTSQGVYHIVDSVARDANGNQMFPWVDITSNLFSITHDIFGDPNLRDTLQRNLKTLAVDWRYAIPDDFDNPPANPTDPARTHPVLYVAGEGGVLVSYDNGGAWRRFPSAFPNSVSTTPQPPGAGGGFPVSDVRDLDLALGHIDPATGQPLTRTTVNGQVATSPDLLTASTFGRGAFSIRLAPVVFPDSVRLLFGGQRIPAGGDPPPTIKPDLLTFEGFSAQSANGNTVEIQVFEVDPLDPTRRTPLETVDASGMPTTVFTNSTGRFTVRIDPSVFATDGPKKIGFQAVDRAGVAGNIAIFDVVLDATAPAPPDQPDLQTDSDTGSSNFDNITSDRTPTFDISGIEAGATVTLFRDNGTTVTQVGQAVAGPTETMVTITDPGIDTNNDGSPDGLPNGDYLYTARQTDTVGNVGTSSVPLRVLITNADPENNPAAPDLVGAEGPPAIEDSDTGRDDTDNITRDNTPTFVLSGAPGQTLTLYRKPEGAARSAFVAVGSRTGPGAVTDASVPAGLADGVYDYALDTAAGTLSMAVRIDTSKPTRLGVPDLVGMEGPPAIEDSDTGRIDTDNVTRDNTPTFVITGIEPDAVVQLVRDDGTTATVVATSAPVDASGRVTITDPNPATDGDYLYSVRQVDRAGNVSDDGVPLPVTIDTMKPAKPGAPDLIDSSDSGRFTNDQITFVTTPTFRVSGVEQGAVVRLIRNNVVVATSLPADASGMVSITDPGDDTDNDGNPDRVPDGTYAYTAQQIDLAGNISDIGDPLSVTIDTAIATPGAPDLDAASDSGLVDTDNITSNTALAFTITGLEADAVARLFRDGVLVKAANPANASGVASVNDPGPVPDGTFAYTITQEDIAGNISPAGSALDVTVDTTDPAAPGRPDLVGAAGPTMTPPLEDSDTGDSDIDNLTADNTPTFVIAGVEAGGTLVLLRDGAEVARLEGTAGGSVAITDPGDDLDNDGTIDQPVPDGIHGYSARQIDLAGNTGAIGSVLNVTIDTGDPDAPNAPDLVPASDTGRRNDDNITFDTAPTFTVSGVESGVTVELLRDGVVVAQTGGDASGTVTLTDNSGGLTDGQFVYTARQTDAAGSVGSESAALTVTIDLTAPAAPGQLDLVGAEGPGRNPPLEDSDTGPIDFDEVTSDRSPTFVVSGIERGNTVQLVRDDGRVSRVVAEFVATTSGTVAITDPGSVPDGTYFYSVRQVDAASNSSADSPQLPVFITANPDPQADPTVPDLIGAEGPGMAPPREDSDTGRIDTDNITRDTTPTFRLSGMAGQTIELYRKPAGAPRSQYVLVGTITGPGTITDPGIDTNGDGAPDGLPDGIYNYAADRGAGFSLQMAVTIDTTIPAAPAVPDLTDASDSGDSQVDNLTNVNSALMFVITGVDLGATVQLLRDGVVVAESAPADVTGRVTVADPGVDLDNNGTIDQPVSDGGHAYAARQVSLPGNISPASGPLMVTIDTVAPVVSNFGLSPVDDTNVVGDNITTVRQPRMIGQTAPNRPVELIDVDGAVTGTAGAVIGDAVVSQATGTFTLSFPNALPDGTYTVRARVSDEVGNQGLSAPVTITIDATAPESVPNLQIAAGSDTGVKGDGRTSDRRPILSGSTEPNAEVEIVGPEGTVLASGRSDDQGRFALRLASNLVNGSITLQTRTRDLAGNRGALGGPLELTIVTTRGDYDVDGQADLALYRPDETTNTAQFFLLRSTRGGQAISSADFRINDPASRLNNVVLRPDDIPISGDFDGDGIIDTAVFRPNSDAMPGASEWFILGSKSGPRSILFGGAGLDLPAPADYDGDGITDIGVFRPNSDLLPGAAEYFILRSQDGPWRVQFGKAGDDVPIPADYDGDGRDDLAVFRPASDLAPGAAHFFAIRSTAGAVATPFGEANADLPVPADYDGDGSADFAVYRPSTSQWFVLGSTAGASVSTFGTPGDIPTPADYDNDGRADLATFQPSTAQWTINRTSDGAVNVTTFGAPGDLPVLAPLAYRDFRPGTVVSPRLPQPGTAGSSESVASSSAASGVRVDSAALKVSGSLDLGQQAARLAGHRSTLATSTATRSRPAQLGEDETSHRNDLADHGSDASGRKPSLLSRFMELRARLAARRSQS